MDIWRYYDVIHALHTYCNPISEGAILEMEDVLDLKPGMRVLDIASGLGETLLGLAKRHGVSGIGVDISPYFIRRAEARKAAWAPDADVRFLEMKGEDYEPDAPFDVALCIGASWIWNGYEGTLEALQGFVKPGGLIVTGEPYWKMEPPLAYQEAEKLDREVYPTLIEYHETTQRRDLSLLWMRGVTQQEWDRYEMLQTTSLDRFARENPDDPDLEEIREKLLPGKDAYLRWGREVFGFAFWVLRTPTGA